MEDRMLYCRNCGEEAWHACIGRNGAKEGLFRPGEPVWACKICGCRRTDGPSYGPGMDCRIVEKA